MAEFTKAKVKEVSDQIQALLDDLSKKVGVQMTMAGGSFSGDSFTLKIKGNLLLKDGSRYVSDSSNAAADYAAKQDGISYTSPHFIGSIWRLASRGLVRVEEYSTKNRKYPYVCSVYGEGRIKCTASSFKLGSEVKVPTPEEFLTWFTVDVESDAISPVEEKICDDVNDYISVRFEDSSLLDKLYECCGNYFDSYIDVKRPNKKAIGTLSARLHDLLILNNDVEGAVALLKDNL